MLAGLLVVRLLLGVPGLKGAATTVSHMKAQRVVVAIALSRRVGDAEITTIRRGQFT